MITAGEWNRTAPGQQRLARLAGHKVDIEALVRGGRRMAQEVAVHPDDRIALVQTGRQGPELHLVHDDHIGTRGPDCRRGNQHQGPERRGASYNAPRAHDYFSPLATISAWA